MILQQFAAGQPKTIFRVDGELRRACGLQRLFAGLVQMSKKKSGYVWQNRFRFEPSHQQEPMIFRLRHHVFHKQSITNLRRGSFFGSAWNFTMVMVILRSSAPFTTRGTLRFMSQRVAEISGKCSDLFARRTYRAGCSETVLTISTQDCCGSSGFRLKLFGEI